MLFFISPFFYAMSNPELCNKHWENIHGAGCNSALKMFAVIH